MGAISLVYMGKAFGGNEKWLIRNHDSAPGLYGATFSPLESLRCDPEWWISDDGTSNDIGESELQRVREEHGEVFYEILRELKDEEDKWRKIMGNNRGIKYH